jgi:hypothetical protein
MRIYYAEQSDPMLLDSLTMMNELHHTLTAFLESPEMSLYLPADCTGTPEPYQELLSALTIQKKNGPICLSITPERGLRLTGSPENLKIYAGYFHFGEDEEGSHHHPEYVFDGDQPKKDYISANSLSLIIEVDTDWMIEIKEDGQQNNPADGK